ncbi:hypothetical protein CFP56_041266 [Quercus suber]|uniref:Uncharacterized protein n=1 Tax=Quercus suber TaxID=58331 RepID=A0AAW0LKN6_QUESU
MFEDMSDYDLTVEVVQELLGGFAETKYIISHWEGVPGSKSVYLGVSKGILGLMHLGQVRGSTWECLRECFGKSSWPKGVFGLMDLGQVRGSTWQCLRKYSGKSPRPNAPQPSQKEYLRGFERLLWKVFSFKWR